MLAHVPAPEGDPAAPFAMLATLLDQISFGQMPDRTGDAGYSILNEAVRALSLNGEVKETGRLTKLLRFEGAERVPAESVKQETSSVLPGWQGIRCRYNCQSVCDYTYAIHPH